MNQAVIQMYLLILVGVAAVALARWPRWPGPRWRGWAYVRFAVVAALGVWGVTASFHAAGRVDALVVEDGRAHVLERYPERWAAESVWTSLELDTGTIVEASPPEPSEREPSEAGSAPAMRVPRTLRGRVERRTPDGAWIEVGPDIEQPVAAHVTSDGVILSAFDTVYEPSTVYLARFGPSGTLEWRLGAEALGLAEGRLRRASSAPEGRIVLVFEGVAADRSPFEKSTLDTHLIVLSVDASSGEIAWSRRF